VGQGKIILAKKENLMEEKPNKCDHRSFDEKREDSWRKKAALFLISQNVSLFGSSVVGFAIIWYVTLQTSSGRWMTFSIICSLLPQVLISPWAGVWADRYNRKRLIMLSDGIIALATLGLAVAFLAGYESIKLLLAASVVRSICAGIQTPAVNAMYPQLVPVEKLTKVNGINQTFNSLLLLLSPAVGGLALGYYGIAFAFMLDVLTAAAAIIILGLIKLEKQQQHTVSGPVFADLWAGIRFTYEHNLLKRLVICYGVSFFLITPAAFLTPIMIERSYGNEVWRLTANEMIWTVGSLLGGVFVSWRGEFKNKIRTIAISLIGFGITFGLLGTAKWFLTYLLFMGSAGFFMPIIATAETVLIQENVEETMMGRVFSIIQIISTGAMPLAMLFFGPLADLVEIEGILVVTGALLAGLGLVFGRYKYEETGRRETA
jgi:DHA3 family macrolide efflux protein-like MFS transporter